MTTSITLIQELPVANTLGEGVIWQQDTQTAFWTDIQQNKMYSWKFGSIVTNQYECPERLGCFGFTTEQEWFICGFESGFAFFHPLSGQIEWIAKIESEYVHTRLNDGRVDRQGRFWAGTMMEDEGVDENRAKAALYRLDNNRQVTKVIEQVKVANGLCWDPSGDILYFADSPTQTIIKANMNKNTGELQPASPFINTDKHAFPDGSCIDSEGCLWNAQWGSSTIKRYSPTGELLLVLDTPCEQPSCVAFGGPDLQHLFVTSARQNLSTDKIEQEPSNGNLFVYQTPYTGLAESVCTLQRQK
ncbi:SMP-30/gluconolactonase/LRE family protein [Paraglaciecola sp. L3A3]|uniref:SMP-30/gluconolactonase/LRE family protein n=1 Tax=Paraglaciecola sp. L3A3 TaxID=2686358 RepID=UPI00131CFA6D|nr:SMP-30/gluconolactonase/LRE family protein [Paraglaciecola sp. L3A3]